MKGKNFTEIYRKKTKTALWVVSNCRTRSRREQFVRVLREHIDVDILGRCSNRSFSVCGHTHGLSCVPQVVENYKFYLALENHLCKDYVTEKYFNLLAGDVIPVVRNGAQDFSLMTPSRYTYVNAFNFLTVSNLAKFMEALGNNEEEYIKYLKEINRYKGWHTGNPPNGGLCSLCKLLHTRKPSDVKMYEDMDQWWNANTCLNPHPVDNSELANVAWNRLNNHTEISPLENKGGINFLKV